MAPPFSASAEKANSPHLALLEQILGSSVMVVVVVVLEPQETS